MATELPELLGAGVYSVHTGAAVGDQADTAPPTAAQLGLRPPRFCAACGRKLAVQVRPNGWWAKCSRHGKVDSADLGTA